MRFCADSTDDSPRKLSYIHLPPLLGSRSTLVEESREGMMARIRNSAFIRSITGREVDCHHVYVDADLLQTSWISNPPYVRVLLPAS